MSRAALGRAAGMDFVPDMEDWWGDFDESVPPPRHTRPRLRVITNDSRVFAETREPKRVKHKNRARQLRLNRVLMAMTGLVLAICLYTQIGRLAEISAQSKRIAQLNADIKNMRSNQQNLQVRLSMQQSIERVRSEALNTLGMVYPDESQIRVISIPGYDAGTADKTADNSGTGG